MAVGLWLVRLNDMLWLNQRTICGVVVPQGLNLLLPQGLFLSHRFQVTSATGLNFPLPQGLFFSHMFQFPCATGLLLQSQASISFCHRFQFQSQAWDGMAETGETCMCAETGDLHGGW